MIDKNRISNEIKEELQKASPSRKKITSYFLDLRSEKSLLTDSEFYDVIGGTFKVNLRAWMDSLYKELKKKWKKLYGVEKEHEMEKYLIDKFGLYRREQIIDRIKQEFEYEVPSEEANRKLFLKSRILTYLYEIQSKEEYKSLSNIEFNEIIGSIFKLEPIFFIDFIYGELKVNLGRNKGLEMEKYLIEKLEFVVNSFKLDPKLFMEKLYNPISESLLALYGYEESWKIIKNIIINYCLYEGEKILYEFTGDIEMLTSNFNVQIIDGRILLTNYRFIVNGKLKVGGLYSSSGFSNLFVDLIHGVIISARKSRRKSSALTNLINSSAQQELPCFGYEFPIKNLYGLKKIMNYTLNYYVDLNNVKHFLKVSAIERNVDISSNEKHRDNIFEILGKEIN